MYDTVELNSNHYREIGYPIGGIDERSAKRVYGMVTNIDDNLKKLFERMNELGIYDNTIIIFMTDNGPQQRRYNSGLRDRKSSVYDGGTRVPFYVRYPNRFAADTEVDIPIAHIDVLPTLMDLIGGQTPENIDGQSMLPLLDGITEKFVERPIFTYWQRGFPEKYRNVAMRKGDYKFVGHTDYPWNAKEFELFNIADDPSELYDISEDAPELFAEMRSEFDQVV